MPFSPNREGASSLAVRWRSDYNRAVGRQLRAGIANASAAFAHGAQRPSSVVEGDQGDPALGGITVANLPFRYANQDVEIDGCTVLRGDAVPWGESGRNAIGRGAGRFDVTYVRQSSAHQVLHNRESSALQAPCATGWLRLDGRTSRR